MLALLFDRMTTHVKSQRFRAQEALLFFENMMKDTPQNVLKQEIALQPSWDTLSEDSNIYWSRLPSAFSTVWRLYKTPSLSLLDRALYGFVQLPYGWDILHCIRAWYAMIVL